MSPGFEMKKITGQGYLTCDELFASFQTHHEVHGLVKQMEKVGKHHSQVNAWKTDTSALNSTLQAIYIM